jgi:periplasmic protein TonB
MALQARSTSVRLSGAEATPLFSLFSQQSAGLYRSRREAFLFSLAGQALILALLTYFTCCVLEGPKLLVQIRKPDALPLIFSGSNGGGGGSLDKVPPSHGDLPHASLAEQLVSPTVMLPREMPKLPAEETVMVAPDVRMTSEGPVGDPMSKFSAMLSNGPGGPGGVGEGCCGGVGDSVGPHAGSGPPGIYMAGKAGVTLPEAIFSPEPAFSDEARKAKHQGVVELLVVVGRDGRTYDIRVARSLGMGLDEKAVESVSR